jgi:4-alpha-glucanotransferase
MALTKRSSGVLLHISSLPGGHGIGDLGRTAHEWVDFLVAGSQKYWQILPTAPTGYGNSPYSSCSAFAGNPLLISLDDLVAQELLKPSELEAWSDNQPHWTNFDRVRTFKNAHLRKAFKNFEGRSDLSAAYQQFRDNSPWLETFVKYLSPKEDSDPNLIRFTQFIFATQIQKLKAYANQKGILLIGDLPMYIAEDSADKYERPELFELDTGFTAGTPPSPAYPKGQRWGNPLFRWDQHKKDGFAWWIQRARALLQQVDVIRLDYFNGYARYWAISKNSGHWRRGPGFELFSAARHALVDLPFIAEDLGELTREIHHLRDSYQIPSMKVLQYGFDGLPGNPYLPKAIGSNAVVYTGTHDTDTSKGWWRSAPDYVKENCRRLIKADGRDISWDMLKLAAHSKANLAVLLYQDVLCLGSEARFNTPGGVSAANWSWRAQHHQITPKIAESLAWLAKTTNRF